VGYAHNTKCEKNAGAKKSPEPQLMQIYSPVKNFLVFVVFVVFVAAFFM